MNNKYQYLPFLFVLSICACDYTENSRVDTSSHQQNNSNVNPQWEGLRNATLHGLFEGEEITLVDGHWQGIDDTWGASRPSAALMDYLYANGDLDGDNREEIVGVISVNYGGTGLQKSLIVMDKPDLQLVQKGIISLGDRTEIRDLYIDQGKLLVDVLQVGAEDPFCCPSELATRHFKFDNGHLIEASTTITGKASLATLQGAEWSLQKLSHTQSIDQTNITLSFVEHGVTGSSGCNNYSGNSKPGDYATALSIGPLTTTRKLCPPAISTIEQQYLSALQSVDSWSFDGGLLRLNYTNEEQVDYLLFKR